tara:strand:+ start:84 stop:476 length:393 start_codon:yes stop_codon:yes gene_type:complete
MIDTDKHERILKQYKFRKNELKIYFDRSEEHPLGAYKFRQKDWQVRRFINDARQARWTLSNMKEIYDEAMEEVKRLREELRILNGMNIALWDTVENYDICLDDFTMIDLFNPPEGYEFCEDEERWVKKND